jgi:hypothetical protein
VPACAGEVPDWQCPLMNLPKDYFLALTLVQINAGIHALTAGENYTPPRFNVASEKVS